MSIVGEVVTVREVVLIVGTSVGEVMTVGTSVGEDVMTVGTSVGEVVMTVGTSVGEVMTVGTSVGEVTLTVGRVVPRASPPMPSSSLLPLSSLLLEEALSAGFPLTVDTSRPASRVNNRTERSFMFIVTSLGYKNGRAAAVAGAVCWGCLTWPRRQGNLVGHHVRKLRPV